MTSDGSGRGTPEHETKTSERIIHIADHLIRESSKTSDSPKKDG